MSKLTKDEQTQVVKQALELEESIKSGQESLTLLQGAHYKAPPKPPVRKTAQKPETFAPDYSALPQVQYTYEQFLRDDAEANPTFLSKIFTPKPILRAIIIALISGVLGMIFGSLSYNHTFFLALAVPFYIIPIVAVPLALYFHYKKRAAYNARVSQMGDSLQHSPAYLNAKEAADRAAQQKQEEADRRYQAQQEEYDREYEQEKTHYDTVTMPEYNEKKAAWVKKHEEKIRAVAEKLRADRQAQSDLYETTKVVPMQYRDLDALTYIYQIMSTSDYDIMGAVDMYDKEVARRLERERIEAQHRAAEAAEEQNYHLRMQNELNMEQNDLLAQQNEELEKARREQNLSNAAAFVQRHNTNKYLKNRNKK